MYNKRLIRYLLFFAIALLVLGGGRLVQAEAPTNVGLLYFTATPQADGIRLDWKTESELGTAGFIVKRATGSSTTFVTLDNIGFVASQGGVATGATYSYVDDTAVYSQSYSYKLVEIETDSSETDLETVSITFIIVPTATPVVIGGGNPTTTAPTNTPVPTSTPSPAATPTATAVPATNVTSQSPTATSRPPTITPSPATATATRSLPTTTPSPESDTSQPPPDTVAAFAQGTEGTAYPAPITPEPNANNAAYPANQPPTLAPPDPTSYPTASDTDPLPTMAIIGSQTEESAPESASPSAEAADAVRGRIFLWVGFVIALLIFITGVAGSIILYRRRRE